MASPFVKSNKMKRMESRKSHSWWWDSHISPKNSKWLQENLEEMDQHVKRMLKLIEEDADSFAKKAELYFKKRPELVSLVEEFYRMYRSLAERYDNVTGELRKNLHSSDLQSQSSGISDVGSEPTSTTIPSPERRPPRTKSGPRPAGFDFFLGSGSDLNSKEGDESSTLDSQSESRSDDEDDDDDNDDDDSSVNNYAAPQSNGGDERRRITELENELHEVKEKLNTQKEEIFEGFKTSHFENCEFHAKNREYEEEIARLKVDLEKYKSFGSSDNNVLLEEGVSRIHTLEKELSVAHEKLRGSEEEVARLRDEIAKKGSVVQNLQDQLKSAQKEGPAWKNKLEREKREVSKLMDRIARYKTNLSEREQEIRGLKEAINNANKSLSEENEQLKEEMKRMTKERAYLEDNLKELDLRCQSLEVAKAEIEVALGAHIEQLKDDIVERENHVEELNERLTAVTNDLNGKIADLMAEISLKNDRMAQMSKHLHDLHMQHVELIGEAEKTRKIVEELRAKIKDLEIEMDRKQEIILQGAEEKREAIRQLCYSIEHYRTGYHELRDAVVLHKRPVVRVT